jgi:AraC family transcriptional regulator of adaptative response / DNA-3-methyladenine glycosylase II
VDAVPRLAHAAAHRIAAGALNGHSVAHLAAEFGVSERHLRRALQRELGVSPVELALTHRLLLAKRLLADTSLSVTRVAFASGFQSLGRFNAVFRERYRLSPNALRHSLRSGDVHRSARGGEIPATVQGEDFLGLTLAYRAPFAWDVLVELLRRDAIPGIEIVEGRRYGRTVRLDGLSGVVLAEDAATNGGDATPSPGAHLNIRISASLLPALMPALARLRHLFDLDAEPAVVDDCLEQGGLGALVRRHPGVRILGAFDGFEAAFRILLRGRAHPGTATHDLAGRVARALGEPLETGVPGLIRLTPSAERVADAGASSLVALGVPRRRARAVTTAARMVAEGRLRLESGSDVSATRRALMEIDGIGDRLATSIVMRALCWPDAFPASDRALQRAAGVSNPDRLRARAEKWRPWRAYAALHLWLHDEGR